MFRYGGNNLRCECSLRPIVNWIRAGEEIKTILCLKMVLSLVASDCVSYKSRTLDKIYFCKLFQLPVLML